MGVGASQNIARRGMMRRGKWKGRRAQGNVSRATKDVSQRRRMAMSRWGAGPGRGGVQSSQFGYNPGGVWG